MKFSQDHQQNRFTIGRKNTCHICFKGRILPRLRCDLHRTEYLNKFKLISGATTNRYFDAKELVNGEIALLKVGSYLGLGAPFTRIHNNYENFVFLKLLDDDNSSVIDHKNFWNSVLRNNVSKLVLNFLPSSKILSDEVGLKVLSPISQTSEVRLACNTTSDIKLTGSNNKNASWVN